MVREAAALANHSPAPGPPAVEPPSQSPNRDCAPARPSPPVNDSIKADFLATSDINTKHRPIGTVSLDLFVLAGPTHGPTPQLRSVMGVMGFDPTDLIKHVLGHVDLPSSFDLYLSMDTKPNQGDRAGPAAAFRVVTGRIRFPPALPIPLPDSVGYFPTLGFIFEAKKKPRSGAGGRATQFKVNGTVTSSANHLPRPTDAYRIAAKLALCPIKPSGIASFFVTGNMNISPTKLPLRQPLPANPTHHPTQPLPVAPKTHHHSGAIPTTDLTYAYGLPTQAFYFDHHAGLPSSGLPSLTFTETTRETAPTPAEDLTGVEEPPVGCVGVTGEEDKGIGFGGIGAWDEELPVFVLEKIPDEDLMELDGGCDYDALGVGSGRKWREEDQGEEEFGGFEYDEEEVDEQEDEVEEELGNESEEGL